MTRVAVIGVGAMGQHHARVYNDLDSAELVAVVDVNPAHAETVGRRFKVPAYADFEAMISHERPGALSVVVPTAHHYAVGRAVLERGIHVLIEKPITATAMQAEDLVHFAAERDLCLAVGHVERFNPAVVS